MKIKNILDEDFINYKSPSMFIGTAICNWKCCMEQNMSVEVCQNAPLAQSPTIDYPIKKIYHRYISNDITTSICIGGLEPMLQFDELYELIKYFRLNGCYDTFVIYTGYYPDEIQDKLDMLINMKNIVVKFGRYMPNQEKHYDDILGVYLASDNQYAEVIS